MDSSGLTAKEAKVPIGDGNNVQIMTIHKSKGLEFPIVILAGAYRGLQNKADGGKITFHKDYGIDFRLSIRQRVGIAPV
jgi:ATP-dependent helicase/nuclease subunit A